MLEIMMFLGSRDYLQHCNARANYHYVYTTRNFQQQILTIFNRYLFSIFPDTS